MFMSIAYIITLITLIIIIVVVAVVVVIIIIVIIINIVLLCRGISLLQAAPRHAVAAIVLSPPFQVEDTSAVRGPVNVRSPRLIAVPEGGSKKGDPTNTSIINHVNIT